jgi:hypothetical protein
MLMPVLLRMLQCLGSGHSSPVLPLDVQLGHSGVGLAAEDLLDGHLALLAGEDLGTGVWEVS